MPQAVSPDHLAGIVTGYLVAWDAFAWLDTASTSLLLLGVVAAAAGTYETDPPTPSRAFFFVVPERRSVVASVFPFFRKATSGDFAGAGRRLGANPRPPGCSSPWRALTRDDDDDALPKPPNEKAKGDAG